MLLLYRIRIQICKKTFYKFTFHYASTLSHGKPEYQSEMQYLHSTMLLLYQAVSCKSQSYHFYLHSTMLLLYQAEIPLFYDRGFDLHSTMLLLYHNDTLGMDNVDIIYIPLCFYFILFTSCLTARKALIYIPLCFYFIDDRFSGETYIFKNLHSTMLLLYLLALEFNTRLTKFTFHYASTLSRTSFSLLFSSIQVYSLSTLFSSLDSPQKSSYPHFTKYEFPLIFQALSISQQFFSISGRQS